MSQTLSATVYSTPAFTSTAGFLCRNSIVDIAGSAYVRTTANGRDIRPYAVGFYLVPGGGVEPPRYEVPADFESAASASSAIPAAVSRVESTSLYGPSSGLQLRRLRF